MQSKEIRSCDGRLYFLITTIIFGLVACLHLLRLVNHWSVIIGPWTMPMWISWIGLGLSGFLFIWSLKSARKCSVN